MNVSDVQGVVSAAIGGDNIGETVEGLQRFPINVRYPREVRDSVEKIRNLPVVTERGAQIPLSAVARIRITDGPPMLKSENARLSGWVYVDIRGRDLQSVVRDLQRAVAEKVQLTAGYSIAWSGQFEYLERATQRMKVVVPFTLAIIFVLLYLTFRDAGQAMLIMASIPFALVGGFWLIYLLGHAMSVASAVGFIALAGVAAEFGVVMLLYLRHAWDARVARGATTEQDLLDAIRDGDAQCAVGFDAKRLAFAAFGAMAHADAGAGQRVEASPPSGEGCESRVVELCQRCQHRCSKCGGERIALRHALRTDFAEIGRAQHARCLECRARSRRQRDVQPEPRDDAGTSADLGAHLQQQPAELAIPPDDVVRPLHAHLDEAQPLQGLGDRDADREAKGRKVGRRLRKRPGDRECEARAERRKPSATAAPASRTLQFGERHAWLVRCRRSRVVQVGVGRVRFEQDFEVGRQRRSLLPSRGADSPLVEQFDTARQPVTAARQALDVHPEIAQLTDHFPDGGPTDLHLDRERRARMQRAVREQAE